MSDIETKQQFLRSEIIDQGYDPNEFSAFMGTIRGEDGLDLEKWSFSDLQTVVSQFKAQYSQNQTQEQNQIQEQNQTQEQNQQEQNMSNQNENQEQGQNIPDTQNPLEVKEVKEEHIEGPPKNSVEDKFPNEPFEDFEQIIKTEKLVNNDITDQNNLSIIISNPTKVNASSFFSSSYYQYTVQTNPVGYKVVRKLSDFTFLNETLPLINPAVFNPVLPHFEFGLKDDSPKKLLYIQNYMNSLVEIKFFRTLPIVFQFLTVPQVNWNILRDNTYSKIKQYPMSKMPTLEGEFHIKVNKNEDNKGMEIKDEINKKSEAFDNLNTAMDELLSTMEKLSVCFKTLSKSLLDLTNNHKDNEALKNIFNRLSSLSKIRANDFLKERDFLRDEIKYYFKFINKENVSYLKKYDEFKDIREEYKSKYEKLKKSPNKPQRDLDMVKRLRTDYGLQLLMINSEYKKLMERQAYRSIIQFNKFTNNKDVLLQNYNNCLKLLDFNGDANNIIDDSQKKEEDQGKEKEQEEVTPQKEQ
jgi:hypothetical protein